MPNKILAIDDNSEILYIVESSLTRQGYEVLTASDGESGLRAARDFMPQLIILDVMMPKMDGFQVCRKLRAERSTSHIPILFLTGRSSIEDMEIGFEAGGADYLSKPFFVRELVARVEALIRRAREQIDAHPRTMLPGRLSFDQRLMDRIKAGAAFAVGYVDLDNFKAFNDRYGFYRGDLAIACTAEILDRALRACGNPEDFLGHIGGDDFLFITTPDKVETVCQQVLRDFDASIRQYYDPADLSCGYLVQRDRRGISARYPIMTVSISVITNHKRKIEHPARVSEIAAELKAFLKNLPVSKYKIDQRADDDTPVPQRSLLVVEPDPAVRLDLAGVIEAHKLAALYVTNGAEALLMADQLLPDAIVLGADPSLIDLAQLYQLFRSSERLQQVPILLLLSDQDPRLSEVRRSLRPADRLLAKPLDPAQAAQALRELLHT